MKCKHMGIMLASSADFLTANGGDESAELISMFLPLFDGLPHLEVIQVTGLFSVSTAQSKPGIKLRTLIPILVSIRDLLAKLSHKNTDDLSFLIEQLQLFENFSIEGFVSDILAENLRATNRSSSRRACYDIRQDLVSSYLGLLESHLGRETEFNLLLTEIGEKGVLNEDEVKLLAKRFYGEPGRSKKVALQNIALRQAKHLHNCAKEKATGLRSAA